MVYYINIFFELILALVLLYGKLDNTKLLGQKTLSSDRKRLYCIICGVIWILISGLRGLNVGSDTLAYYYSYQGVKNTSTNDLFQKILYMFTTDSSIKDPGYDFFVKLTQMFTDNYQIFLIIIALIFMIPFLVWVLRESKNPMISFILYSTLFYAFFSITGIRQTIATALVVLIGDKFIKDRKIVSFLIVTLVASLFHKTVLVFIPFYFLSRIKINRRTIVISGASFLVSVIFRSQLKNIFIMISGYEDYMHAYAGAGTPTFTIILLALFVMSIFAYKNDKDLHINGRYYIALYLALFFVPLTWINPSSMRIVQYFSLYLVLLIPEMVNAIFKEKDKVLVTFIIAGILIFLLLKSNPYYVFFWQ